MGDSRLFQVPGYAASTQVPETQGAHACPPVGRSPHCLQRAWLVGGHSQAAVLLSKDDGRKSVVLRMSGSNPQKNETQSTSRYHVDACTRNCISTSSFPSQNKEHLLILGTLSSD